MLNSPTPKSTLQSLGGIRFFLYRDPEFQADAYELIVYRDDCLKLPGPIANLVRSVKTDGCIWLWERNTCEGARRLACPQFSENKDLGKITYQNRVSAVSIAPGQTSN
ncbi:hypothetical protein G9A89_000143 [Geosiphon pyriformis]|nr:hypothetical protein G9A89_000143 [Geosiphon pyriformis]